MNQDTTTGSGRLSLEWLFASASAIGVLLAGIPPYFIDPQLANHIVYGAREYEHSWVLWVFAALSFVITLLFLKVSRTAKWKIFGSVAPFFAICAVLVVLLQPELPHGNVLDVSVIWGLITIVAAGLQYSSFMGTSKLPPKSPVAAQVEYLKQNLNTVRGIVVGLTVAYIGLIGQALHLIHEYNSQITTEPSEQMLLNFATNWKFGAYSVFYVLGILVPLAWGAKRLPERLLEVEEPPGARDERQSPICH